MRDAQSTGCPCTAWRQRRIQCCRSWWSHSDQASCGRSERDQRRSPHRLDTTRWTSPSHSIPLPTLQTRVVLAPIIIIIVITISLSLVAFMLSNAMRLSYINYHFIANWSLFVGVVTTSTNVLWIRNCSGYNEPITSHALDRIAGSRRAAGGRHGRHLEKLTSYYIILHYIIDF